MSTSKKIPSRRKKNVKKTSARVANVHEQRVQFSNKLQQMRFINPLYARMQLFLQRRPHRSFKRTYRRDYVRSLNIPGYWAFTNYVRASLWSRKKLFFGIVAAYALITIAVTGLASQDIYSELRLTLNETGADIFEGVWGEIGKAGLLLFSGITGSFNEASSDPQVEQGVYTVIIGLLTWLTTVWLLRAIIAGRTPKLRDGIYNAGAPIVPTFLVASVVVLQLLPVALIAFGYSAAVNSGLLEGGVEAMLFWTAAGLLAVLSLYWLTSTLIALVIVTLPGMYPLQALKTAGDLVVGRRLRILLRLLWLVGIIVVAWIVILIPFILFDGWIRSVIPAIAEVPLVPLALLLMSSLTIVWMASYIYLFYRKVVDDDATPA